MNAAIEIKGLGYSYGNSVVLKDLSFSVPKGEFFVIIGPNGSGKTTLMKVISGIMRPQNGQLEIFGRDIKTYSRKDLAKTIAFVPQMAQVDFPFSVMEVILLGRSPHLGVLGLEQERDLMIAEQAMSFTGVEYLASRNMDQLSGGEIQRVFIARAICQEPQIMLLDEPTASLDLAHQIRVMDLMERLKQEKRITVVIVSHDVNLAAMYGERLLLLKDGEMVSCGFPGEVLTYKTLEHTYGCRLLVDKSPVGKFPRVTLVPEKLMKP